MRVSTRVGLLAGAAALTLTGVSFGVPAQEGTQQSQDQAARIAALEAKIASLEAAQNKDWLTEQRASEIRGLVQDVLADADTRASLLQAGMTSGYDNGFVLGSADGNWLLRTNFLMQQRFIWNRQEEGAAVDGDRYRYGFENTRSKFILSGNVVNKDWFYLVTINVGTGDDAQNDNRTGVGEAYLGYDYGNGWKVKMGSMALPFMREQLVGPEYQLTVERSNVNYLFTTGYSDGLAVSYTGDKFAVTGAFSDGFNQGQTIWNNGPAGGHAEYAFTGRAEFLAMGTWDQFKDFTSPRDSETGVLVGGAVHWEKGEYGTAPASETEFLFLTGDASVEFNGINLFGSVVWTDVEPQFGSGANPWGFVVQGGVYLTDTWEIFGRFEWADPDVAGVDELSIVTGGINWYFSHHNAKWTTDIGWGINPVLAPSTITGFRTDLGDNEDQVVIRTQWQLYF
jgi:hypothetical protein